MKGVKDCECGGETTVIATRMDGYGRIRRRRKCLICGRRFTTLEVRDLRTGGWRKADGFYKQADSIGSII